MRNLVLMDRLEAHSGSEPLDMPGKAKYLSIYRRSECLSYHSWSTPWRLPTNQPPPAK